MRYEDSPVQGHFFSKATPEEVSKDRGLEGVVLCRVQDNGSPCPFTVGAGVKNNDSMRMRNTHIKNVHPLMLLELQEFRRNQTGTKSKNGQMSTATCEDFECEDAEEELDQDHDQRLPQVQDKRTREDSPSPSLPDPASSTHQVNHANFELKGWDTGTRAGRDHSPPAVEEQVSQVEDPPQTMTIAANPRTASGDELTKFIAGVIVDDPLSMSILDTTLVKGLISFFHPTAVVLSRAAIEHAHSVSYMESSSAAKFAILNADITLGSLTADIQKSQQGKSFMGLAFHYLSGDFEPQTVPLVIRSQKGLAPSVVEENISCILHEWNLKKKVFCGTSVEGSTLESTMKLIHQEPGKNTITGITCACHKIQLCINDALAECEEEVGPVLERSNNYRRLIEERNEPQDQSGEDQQQQQKIDRWKGRFWSSPTMCSKSSVDIDDMRLYWCNLYLLVFGCAYKLFRPLKMTWRGGVYRHYERKLQQAALNDEEIKSLKAVLRVLQPLFDFWVSISGGGSGDNSCNDSRKDRVSLISKVYPAICDIIEKLSSPVRHPTANALRMALLGQLDTHWDLDKIPDPVVVATVLDPATLGHPIIKQGEQSVDVFSRARSIILKKVPGLLLGLPSAKAGDANTYPDLSTKLDMEFCDFFSAVNQDLHKDLWDDPRPWWQRHAGFFPLLSPVARVCFSIQATSLPSSQLFGGAQGTESILTGPQGDLNDVEIQLLMIRNLQRFLRGHRAP